LFKKILFLKGEDNIRKIKYIYITLLILFTIYAILDTFIISTVYEVVDNNKIVDNNIVTGNIISNDNYYEDDNIKISLTTYREYDTNIYVADVIVNSSDYLKTYLAKSSYGKNITEKTSVMANNVGAILAINGDYYGARESGYVLKNGVIYRNKVGSNQEDLVIYEDGRMEIINEKEVSLEELKENGAYNILSFGPGLISNEKIIVSSSDEVDRSKASNPRTAIGMISENHYVFVVSDGRTNESEGLSLYQLALFMTKLNCKTAYNLDGGGSSTIYFNGNIVNNPTTNGRKISERSVSDIVYIGY